MSTPTRPAYLHGQTPPLQPGANQERRPYQASAAVQQALARPTALPEDWHTIALTRMGQLLRENRALSVFMDACVHCGACSDKCQFFLGSGDPNNMPVARQDLFRSVYRRYFTPSGRLLPRLVGARELTPQVLDEWYSYFWQCSECRRCAMFCPHGIDTAEITMAARAVLDSVGYGQKYCNDILNKVHSIGNNLGMRPPALAHTLEALEEDLHDDTGLAIRLPLDQQGADILLVTPSADFFAEPHVESLLGYAKVFHGAGQRWTLSSLASEAGNFGLFVGDHSMMKRIALRIRDAALELGVKRIVVGECGHAWRVAYSFWDTLFADDTDKAQQLRQQLDPRYPLASHICEYTWDLIQRGALRFDKSANDQRIITFHDSCNVARGAGMGQRPGDQFSIPRHIIRAVANHFVDMAAHTIGPHTFCCGGGAGLLSDDWLPIRLQGALPRMEALQQVVDHHQVNFMATICAICKAQFSQILPHYGHKPTLVGGVHQLVSTAIILG